MEMRDYNYNEIKIGYTFEFKRILTIEDINYYARLTGDFNPLHCDEKYAKNNLFKGCIAHGMLAGSLFSTLLGMICPGKKNLYLSQNLNFKKPIYPNTNLIIKGEVINKVESTKVLTIKTQIISEEGVMVDGIANVKVRNQ